MENIDKPLSGNIKFLFITMKFNQTATACAQLYLIIPEIVRCRIFHKRQRLYQILLKYCHLPGFSNKLSWKKKTIPQAKIRWFRVFSNEFLRNWLFKVRQDYIATKYHSIPIFINTLTLLLEWVIVWKTPWKNLRVFISTTNVSCYKSYRSGGYQLYWIFEWCLSGRWLTVKVKLNILTLFTI